MWPFTSTILVAALLYLIGQYPAMLNYFLKMLPTRLHVLETDTRE